MLCFVPSDDKDVSEGIQQQEYEADSLEEKNEILDLLKLIIQHNTVSDMDGDAEQAAHAQSVTVSKPILKEGVLEKKGHNMKYFNWAPRVVRLRHGELAYYKVGAAVVLWLIRKVLGRSLTGPVDFVGCFGSCPVSRTNVQQR